MDEVQDSILRTVYKESYKMNNVEKISRILNLFSIQFSRSTPLDAKDFQLRHLLLLMIRMNILDNYDAKFDSFDTKFCLYFDRVDSGWILWDLDFENITELEDEIIANIYFVLFHIGDEILEDLR